MKKGILLSTSYLCESMLCNDPHELNDQKRPDGGGGEE